MSEIIDAKVGNPQNSTRKNEPIWANPEILHFSWLYFQQKIFISMAKEYQSEKSPIFYSQKSKKTRRKLLKMSHIKAYKVDQMFCNTQYKGGPNRWLLLHISKEEAC